MTHLNQHAGHAQVSSRRAVLRTLSAGLSSAVASPWVSAQSAGTEFPRQSDTRVLILVELKGGNDGLNTLVPHGDDAYYELRPTVAIAKDKVLALNDQVGLHPELGGFRKLFDAGQLAVVQGVGYPQPNLSHFRSIEIWEQGSHAHEHLNEGWATRGLRAGVGKPAQAAEGVLVGGTEYGPLGGARAVLLNNPEAFVRQSRLAASGPAQSSNVALRHLLSVEGNIGQAAAGLRGDVFAFKTEFPAGGFGNSVKACAQVLASQLRKPDAVIPILRLTHGSFDTHLNQPGTHAALLKALNDGLVALQSALTEIGLWDSTAIMTYSEFGRRAKQNQSNGTDHGTASVHFVMGGNVKGGLHGKPTDLTRLDGVGNVAATTDFRSMYAAVAQQWWRIDPQAVVAGKFAPLDLFL